MSERGDWDRARIARTILEAYLGQLPVVRTLQDVLDVNESTAVWLLRWSKRNGTLGHGEHRPVRAVIHRNTVRERGWLVCQACLTHWPCESAGYRVITNYDRGEGQQIS